MAKSIKRKGAEFIAPDVCAPPVDISGMEWHLALHEQWPPLYHTDPNTGVKSAYTYKRPEPIIRVIIEDGESRREFHLVKRRQ